MGIWRCCDILDKQINLDDYIKPYIGNLEKKESLKKNTLPTLISMFVSMEHHRIWCLSLPRQSMEILIWSSLLRSMDLGVVPRNPVLYQLKLNIHQNGRNQLVWWFLSAPGVYLHPYLILNLGTLYNCDGQSLYAPINPSTVHYQP